MSLVLWLFEDAGHETNATTFCAYGKIFVEFDEHGKRWGTMLLDSDGRPMSCSLNEIKESTKGVI